MHRRMMAACCVSPQCCTSRLQLDSPAPNKLLPLESMSSPAASFSGVHAPSPPPPLPPRSEPPVSRCESCLYRLCGCQGSVQVPSNRSSTDKEESSLDIDLNDPVLLQALDDCINRGSRMNPVTPGNSASTDVNERLKDVDFISMFFRNYQRTPKEESIPEELDSPLLNAHHPSPVAADTLYYPDVDVENSSPVIHSQSSDVSSSLPSSFQLDGIQKRPFAPANSPASNVEQSLPTTTESDHSYRNRVPAHLQRQFAIMFDPVRMHPNCFGGSASVGHSLSAGGRNFRRRTCPYSMRRIRRRQCLGSRPPCLGQEQSPIRGISCIGQESMTPVVPTLRVTALTPDYGDQTLVATPPQTFASPATGTLPTVKRGLQFSSGSKAESSESEAYLRMTPKRPRESSVKCCNQPFSNPIFPGVKNSAEKVRSWLQRMQDSSTDAGMSVPCTPVTGQSPLSSSRQSLRCRKRKAQQQLHLFPDQKYKRPSEFCGNQPLESYSKACGNKIPDEDRISLLTEENPNSSHSSGFLADRSSTTWSSLRTSSIADRHTPSLPDQQQMSSWNNDPGDTLIPVVTPEPSDRHEYPVNDRQNNQSPGDAARLNDTTYAIFDDLLNESSSKEEYSNNARCDQDEMRIIHDEEESSPDDIRRLDAAQSPATTRRRYILMKSLKQMGQHLRKKTVKDARITTLAVL